MYVSPQLAVKQTDIPPSEDLGDEYPTRAEDVCDDCERSQDQLGLHGEEEFKL